MLLCLIAGAVCCKISGINDAPQLLWYQSSSSDHKLHNASIAGNKVDSMNQLRAAMQQCDYNNSIRLEFQLHLA